MCFLEVSCIVFLCESKANKASESLTFEMLKTLMNSNTLIALIALIALTVSLSQRHRFATTAA